MCIFSQPVDHVGSTRIFVSDMGGGHCGTAYQMAYRAAEPVAMILPVPVLKGTGDEALTFVDLGGYDQFFVDLARCFPPRPSGGYGGAYGGPGFHAESRLLVHEVGNYVASYVPSIADFPRIDPRFRLPDAAWETLPDYHDFGFAVFQLRPGREVQDGHPIAFRYPAEHPGELFFPTVHIHDGGRAAPVAEYDHILYYQRPEIYSTHRIDLEIATYPPRSFPDLVRCSRGLVSPDDRLGRLKLRGDYPNADVVILEGAKPLRVEIRPARSQVDLPGRLDWIDMMKKFPQPRPD